MTTVGKIVLVAALAAVGCKDKSAGDDGKQRGPHAATASQEDPPPPEEKEEDGEDESGGTGTAMALEEGKMGKKDSDRAEGQYKMKKNESDSALAREQALDEARKAGVLGGLGDDKPAAPGAKGRGNKPEGPTRAWFPETFLFEPLVVTDDQGRATVPVRVPDRLTSWRVLALAHSRSGAQGGAVASFLGTLPTYVDLVVPETLVRGDEVRLPIQLVNTTEAAVTTALELTVENATVTGGSGARVIPAQGSLVDYVRLKADKVGVITVRVALRDGDAVVRTIEVLPVGKPMTVTRTGTLAAPRTLTIDGPAGSDAATDRVRLLAFPGALALLRAELGVCTARSSVADDAYALLLAGKASALLTALGDQADPDALRSLGIVTTQRAVRYGRNFDVESATLFTEAALAHPQAPVLARLGQRAAAYLAQHQRPDGTFGGGADWTQQRVLVATADATRAVATASATPEDRQRAIRVAIAASGAFERQLGAVADGYTAAALLASGAIKGPQVDALRAKVREAIVAADDGAKYLNVADGVVRGDGARPSRAEATALAVLALAGDPQAPMADLGATLLGSYDPMRGWGDGRANLVAMRAVLELFKAPVPADVKITLTMDGKVITSGVLDREKLRSVLALPAAAPGLAGTHTWQITAEPAVPGLGFSLTLEGWVPWTATTGGGLELALPPAMSGAVGKPIDVALRAVAPSGTELHVRHALPAGVQVDTPSLEALVKAETITRFEVVAGAVELYVAPLDPGQTFAATYRVIPTLAGTLHSSASLIEASDTRVDVPPTVWTIK